MSLVVSEIITRNTKILGILYKFVIIFQIKMSISNRNESNLNSNQMTNSTQLNELSSSDSNNNNEGNYLFFI